MRKRHDFEIDEDLYTDLDGSLHKNRNSIHSLSSAFGIGCVFVLFGLIGAAYLINNRLPTPLTLQDEKLNPNAFIAERAQRNLKHLTELGPRVTGSYENEVLAVDFLRREVDLIIQKSHQNQTIEMDFQVVNGSGYLKYKPWGKIFTYSNLQNVVVKLHGKEDANNSLLVNCHFDSVPTSPGGSDDGINCVVMLEVLRKMSKQPMRPLHNVVFLFNGAEETGLTTAHGFVTKHKWAKECKVVVNLEAAGAGGRIILFQTGPKTPWVVNYYRQVPHPSGEATGEEIFQSNLIPSDTDFRIFRDYGGMVGLDMAFVKDGYRYHTKFDAFANIPLGSYQHVGDNTLFLVQTIANAPELGDDTLSKSDSVYFDVFGLFMIVYNEWMAIVINLMVVCISFIVFLIALIDFKLVHFSAIKYLIYNKITIVAGWIFAGVTAFALSYVIDKIEYSMSWYSHPWIILGLYSIPTVMCMASSILFLNHDNLSLNIRGQMQAHSTRLIWTFVLLLGTMFGIRSIYAIMIQVFINSVSFLFIHLCRLQYTVRKWQLVYVIFQILPILIFLCQGLKLFTLFIPIAGRVGPDKNVEVIISLLCVFFTIRITSPLIALFNLLRKPKFFFISMLFIFLSAIFILFTPLGFPYSGNMESPTPQRYWILHSRRIFHNENGIEIKRDAGYFILNMDRNSPRSVEKYVDEFKNVESVQEDCLKYLVCGLPLAHPKMIQIIKHSSWIPAALPLIPRSSNLEVLSKNLISSSVVRYKVSLTGPDRLSIYLSPKIGVELINITLLNEIPSTENTPIWNGRPLFVITNLWGKQSAPLEFEFDVKIPQDYDFSTTTEFGLTGIFVHESENQKMSGFIEFLKKFPNWTDITAWLGTFDSYFI